MSQLIVFGYCKRDLLEKADGPSERESACVVRDNGELQGVVPRASCQKSGPHVR
jgi:hypothetical protein